jgi:GDP-L-fucose synthase
MLNRSTRIFVAGHRGLAGSAIHRCLQSSGFTHILTQSRSELDLTHQAATQRFFASEKPQVVILAAAKVGGISANHTLPADFIQENLSIQTNVIEAAVRNNVQHLVFLGSSCIYPRDCPQPIKEEYLLTGPLELTNRAYAVAKIAGVEACWAHNRQHGTRYIAVMPSNLYGPGDNYDLETSHVLPALIRKIHEAKKNELADITCWGSGAAWREFLYSDDLAQACLFLLDLPAKRLDSFFSDQKPPLINLGTGVDIQIRDLVTKVANTVGYKGAVKWDSSRPDGTPRKLLDSTLIAALRWKYSIDLEQGISLAYADFLK